MQFAPALDKPSVMSNEFREHVLWINKQPVDDHPAAQQTPQTKPRRQPLTDPRFSSFFQPRHGGASETPSKVNSKSTNPVPPAASVPNKTTSSSPFSSFLPQWSNPVNGLFVVNSLYSEALNNPLQYMFTSS